MAKRALFFAYGVVCYALFLGTFLYAIGFVGNFAVPKTLDGAPTDPLPVAVVIDLALLAIFAVQHSVMARKGFKERWTRIVPPVLERSTFVLFASLALILLFWQWRPLGGVVWSIEHPTARVVLQALSAAGWGLVLIATFVINHFDLFGLRQVWLQLRAEPYTPVRLRTPGLYRVVRHPLYAGFLIAFWATPAMSAAHLLFAVMTTAYILVAIQLEERDLTREHGSAYEEYRRRVPMLVPFTKREAAAAPEAAPAPRA